MSEPRSARLERLSALLSSALTTAVASGSRRRLRDAVARYSRVQEALTWAHWLESVTFWRQS